MTTDQPPRRRRRPHPAMGARIAATGLGTAGMLALTAVMAAADFQPQPSAAEPAVAGPTGALGGPQAVPDVAAAAPTDPAAVVPIPLTPVPVRRRVVVPDPSAGTSRSVPAAPGTSGSSTTGTARVSPSPRPRPVSPPAATTKGSR